MLIIKNKYLLLVYLLLFIPCFVIAKESKVSNEAQAYIDEIDFNIQVMQGKIGLNEIEKKITQSGVEYYQSGKGNRFILSSKGADVSNYISYRKELTPEYFRPLRSFNKPPNDIELSAKMIADALSLNKYPYRKDRNTFYRGGEEYNTFYHEYDFPSPDTPYYGVRVSIAVIPPKSYSFVETPQLDLTIMNNIAMVTVSRLDHTKQKIPALHSGEATTRNGFWQASVSKNHPQADLINHSAPVYLQWKEGLPDFGLDQKEAKKIKWTWVNDDVEQLKELMQKEKGEQ